ncbi:MAG TPA: hypothetical protein VGX37_08565, partial [Allosphingosinicella sp.]|nr:hypothetical protein [Allosphingosinicella sp.]
ALLSAAKDGEMATLADTPRAPAAPDERFFLRAAIAMALVLAAGFSTQLAMGRSTFASPPLVHAHAITFMGWVTLYLLQNIFVARGNMALHRRLGWIGAVWIVAMLILGCAVTVAMVRRGQVPFFFRPLHFLVFDPMSLFAFAGLTYAAIALRRRTDWHRRLHYCGMSILIGPGFGRLLPMPLLQPWAWEASFAACMLFPIAGIIYDLRRNGRVHPAWRWGVGTLIAALLLTEAITYSAPGAALYRSVTAGSAGASVPPLDFAPPPPGPLMTGRS